MVEGNEKNTNDSDPRGNAPKRRGGLFGSRRGRGRSAETPPVEPGSQPVTESDVPARDTAANEPATAAQGIATDRPARADEQAPAEASAGESTAGTDGADATDGAADASPVVSPIPTTLTTTSLIFHAPPALVPSERDDRTERADRGEREERADQGDGADESSSVRRRTRRRTGEEGRATGDEPANTVVKVRKPREPELITEPQKVKGSTRLEAKKQRRRDGRDAGRRRAVITEAEFLARRESVDRSMVVREKAGRIQIGVLEDGVVVEHYVARNQDASLIGNVYLGRVQNVLPSMEAAFVDIGRGRNAVLYSGEVTGRRRRERREEPAAPHRARR